MKRTFLAALAAGGLFLLFSSEHASAQLVPKTVKICGTKTADPNDCAQPPQLLKTVPPKYTEEARAKKVEGEVAVAVMVGEDGHVRAANVVHGLGYGLDERAVDAVKQWQFQPAVYKGKPVPVGIGVVVKFVPPGATAAAKH